MNKASLKGQTVLTYLDKFSTMSTNGLAKKIYSENEDIFLNHQNARALIRYYKGASGAASRAKTCGTRKYFTKKANDMLNLKSEAEPENYTPYTLPTGCNNILVLADIHIPYHDEAALQAALEYDRSVNTIILNGDLIDFYQISTFIRHPKKPDIRYEIDLLRSFLTQLRDMYPKAQIYYKEGNHEERWHKYMLVKAPELYDLQIADLDEIFELTKLGIHYIKDKRPIRAGKLTIIHGHEYFGGGGNLVSPARTFYLKAKHNVMLGHFHQTSEHTEPNIQGDTLASWSTGCLCDLSPEYSPKPYNKWNHGFATVKVNKDRTFNVQNIRLLNGKVI